MHHLEVATIDNNNQIAHLYISSQGNEQTSKPWSRGTKDHHHLNHCHPRTCWKCWGSATADGTKPNTTKDPQDYATMFHVTQIGIVGGLLWWMARSQTPHRTPKTTQPCYTNDTQICCLSMRPHAVAKGRRFATRCCPGRAPLREAFRTACPSRALDLFR